MSASPELNLAPLEFSVRPVATVGTKEENGRIASPPKTDTDDGECRTPTSEDSKLSSISPSCPPAPRKPRRMLLSKRRLCSEFEFIMVGAKEMEQLFRRRDHQQEAAAPNHAKKRKRQQLEDK